MEINENQLKQRDIYTVTQNDSEYPKRLLKILEHKAPPLLYYCGNAALANMNSVAIVGSRLVDEDAEKYAADLARKAIAEGYLICSGGAKGIDSISEESAIETGGCCISFLSDSMIKKLSRPEIHNAVTGGKMLLISAVNPAMHFNIGNAMARNKYIYAMSQCTFVIVSDYNKGGTWAGAVENIKRRLSNTYIWDNSKYEGNKQLISKGGIGIGGLESFSVADLAAAEVKIYSEQLSLF